MVLAELTLTEMAAVVGLLVADVLTALAWIRNTPSAVYETLALAPVAVNVAPIVGEIDQFHDVGARVPETAAE